MTRYRDNRFNARAPHRDRERQERYDWRGRDDVSLDLSALEWDERRASRWETDADGWWPGDQNSWPDRWYEDRWSGRGYAGPPSVDRYGPDYGRPYATSEGYRYGQRPGGDGPTPAYDRWDSRDRDRGSRWEGRPGGGRWGYGQPDGPGYGGVTRPSQGQESYRGRGPSGYQRSDDRLREDVNDALEDDARVDASEISVQVKGGEVTLTGTVSDRSQKRAAEECAEWVRGVKDVHNQLRVQSAGQSGTSPATSPARS